jgi:hypothetical protein
MNNKIAQKPLTLLGDWSVTVGAFSACFGHLMACSAGVFCRDGFSVVATMMLHQPEKPDDQDTIPQNCHSIDRVPTRKIRAPFGGQYH